MKHFCYYCQKELTNRKTLVTFYFEECVGCKVTYHFNWDNTATMISLDTKIRGKRYSVSHDLEEKRVRVLFWPKTKIKLSEHGGTINIGPDRVTEFAGDYNTITPTNIHERMKLILTFL